MSHLDLKSPVTSPEEQVFLDSVAKDLADSESRKVYADWLEENRDSQRSGFLRKYNAAFDSMKADDFPDFETVPAEWTLAIGARLVKAIVDNDLAEKRDDILALAKPTLVFNDPRFAEDEDELPEEEVLALYTKPKSVDEMKVDATIPVGGSKLYGAPDLPAGTAWPRQKDCNSFYDSDSEIDPETHCGFVCQINFAELQTTQFGKMCPSEGLLSIFACAEMERIGMVDGYVVFTPNVDGLERLSPPAGLLGEDADESNALYDATGFELTEAWGVPSPGDESPFPVLKLKYDDEQHDRFFELTDNIGSNPLSSIGGYTQPTSSDDPLPGAEWIKLICVRDCIGNLLHFCIKSEDLANGNFDNVELSWVDFD